MWKMLDLEISNAENKFDLIPRTFFVQAATALDILDFIKQI